ncbi:MAG: hypothetical protein IBJ14_11185, partial [Hydrogenophaga sp.]|nr:hypothetical protein [Hydrogenophaga sp.]
MATEAPAAKPKGKKTLIIITALVLVLVIGGGLGAFLLMKRGQAEDEEGGEEEEALETGPDPEEAARRFAGIAKLHQQVVKALDGVGPKDPKTQKLRKKLAGQFMELKLAPKMFDALINNLRDHVATIRGLEKEIMQICVKHAGMPRKDFIAIFPKNETRPGWIDKQIKLKRKHSAALARLKPDILDRQQKIKDLEEQMHLVIHDIKEINREVAVGEAQARRAKK